MEDGVGVVAVLVTEVVVDGVGLGSFAVQADVAAIAARGERGCDQAPGVRHLRHS